MLAGFVHAMIVIADRRASPDLGIFTSSLDYVVRFVLLFALAAVGG